MSLGNELDIMIGVDDTGGEGQEIEARNVDQHRQTLLAALIGKDDMEAFDAEWRSLVNGLNTAFGVSEFHAAELWGRTVRNSAGNKEAKKKAEAAILDAFARATQICVDFDVVFVVQTVHEETFGSFLAALRKETEPTLQHLADELTRPRENRKLAALLMLSRTVLQWARKIGVAAGAEGEPKINAEWQVDDCPEFETLSSQAVGFVNAGFARSSMKILESHTSSLVQAADLGAYILNRHMYFVANRKETDAEKEKPSQGFLNAKALLARTEDLVPLMLNIPSIRLGHKAIHAGTYDKLQDAHRASIGLDALDFKRS